MPENQSGLHRAGLTPSASSANDDGGTDAVPRRGRGWIVALGLLAAGGAGAVLVVVATHRSPGSHTSVHEDSALVRNVPVIAAGQDASVAALPATPDAPLSAVVDAAVPLEMAIPCTAHHFMCTATLSHEPSAGQPFEVTAQFAASDHGHAHDLAAGSLSARLEIRNKRTHALIGETTAQIDPSGRWSAQVRLEAASMYHVHLDILQAGREIDSAQLVDLNVAAH